MKRYEHTRDEGYEHTRDEAHNREIMATVERYADNGWKLVSVVAWQTRVDGATLYFKRPVPSPGDEKP